LKYTIFGRTKSGNSEVFFLRYGTILGGERMSIAILAFLLGLFSGAEIIIIIWICEVDKEIRMLQAEADAADHEMEENNAEKTK
jgi:hypothetical protein